MVNIYGILEWIFALVAAGSGVWALFVSESLSSNSGPGIHQKPAPLVLLWTVCVLSGLVAFVIAVIGMRYGGNGN